jgi:hypothetical protein
MIIFWVVSPGWFQGVQADVQRANDKEGGGGDHPKADAFVSGRLNCGPGG